MCFSAGASFTGGILISAIGVATIKKVQNPSHLVFASIPLIFGLQQIAEGFLWLSLLYPQFAFVHKSSTYIFLIMAQVIWPIMVPLSILLMERNHKKKRILWGLLGLGFLLALYYTFCLLSFKINPQIIGCHIKYNAEYPKSLIRYMFAIYLLVTITPFFISSIKRVYVLGIFMFLSCLVAIIFFTFYVTSVWCFFAAILSAVIYWVLVKLKKGK
jgi:hypothetical protein